MDLEFIRRYVERNPYTGGFTVDTARLAEDPALLGILREVWAAGYAAGADDVILDRTVEQGSANPYT